MRVFHFIDEKPGLENLRRRRLKIATLLELNDPFELFSVNLAKKSLRRRMHAIKDKLASSHGLLCFSGDWHNPVQWSHYASKHSGLCLGFDVSDENLRPIEYSRKRLVAKVESFCDPSQLRVETITRFLFTKYSHWHYENEFRWLIRLGQKDPETNLYFEDFSDKMRLAVVIVGARSSITRETLRNALGSLALNVQCFKGRLAFETFRVVRQLNAKLWA